MGKFADKLNAIKAAEYLSKAGNAELNVAALEELGRYQRMADDYRRKYIACVNLLHEVALQRIDGCVTASACMAQELLIAFGEDKMPRIVECKYCEEEVEFSETEFDYSLKIRVCKKCVDEIKAREKR